MRRRTVRSFTLVELMAAMAVLSLLMVALVAMFDQAMRGWRNAQKGIDGRREARTALQMVQRDLSALVIRPGRGIFNETTNNNNKSSDLYFLAALPTSAQATNSGGDICGVGYFVEWDPSLNEGRGGRVLRRYQQEAAQQFTNLQSAPTSNPTRTQLFPSTNSPGVSVETLAQNVSHFRAEIYQWTVTTNSPNGFFKSAGGEDGVRRPAYLMVELAAYDPQTVRTFQGQQDWDNTNNVKKYARTYLWRIVP